MLKFNTLCVVVAITAAPATFADELSETGDFLDGVAAIVNEGVVLKSQLTSQVELITERATAEGMQLPPDDVLREQILERLILSEVQLQRADQIGLEVSDQMLNQQIAAIAQSNGIAFEDMPQMLAQEGVDYAQFRSTLREDFTIEQLRRIEVGQSINHEPCRKLLAQITGSGKAAKVAKTLLALEADADPHTGTRLMEQALAYRTAIAMSWQVTGNPVDG